MEKILLITQVIISVILMFLILVQNKDEGFTARGGGGSFKMTKRGPEKVIFITTGVFGVLFLANALMFIFVK
jgi:protein translocase SecG subunit